MLGSTEKIRILNTEDYMCISFPFSRKNQGSFALSWGIGSGTKRSDSIDAAEGGRPEWTFGKDQMVLISQKIYG